MDETKVLKRVREGNTIIVTSEVKKSYTAPEALNLKNQLMYQQNNLVNQMQNLKAQYDFNVQEIAKYDEMILELSQEPPTVE